ncbi:MAG: hypothetical protein JW829_19320 [Pirellulales bacterium]|nr:hypothetical protein [Pirellulales bacterium]
METIRKHVRKAWIRLVLEQFVHRFLFGILVAFTISVVAIAIPKLLVTESLPSTWAGFWLGGSFIAAILTATIWTLFRHRDTLDAAIAIDHRFGMKERIASSLLLSATDMNTRAGQALVQDALRRVERIDIGEHFRIGLGRRPWMPLIPAVIAVCLIAFVDDRTRPVQADPNAPILGQQLRRQVKKSAESLQKKIDEKKKEAVAKGLKDAESLLLELEKGTEELIQRKDADRKQAAIKLNDLAKQIEKRRDQLGGKDTYRKSFEQLTKINQGPADRIARALNEGNIKQAAEELKKLQEKIAQDGLSQTEQEKLAGQLSEMKKKMEEARDAQTRTEEDLQKQIEDQKRLGNTQNAARLQEELDRLLQNQPQMDQLQQLAEKLGQCQQCLQQGNQAGAQQALEQLAEQLEGIQQQLDEMELLQDAIQQIGEAKNAMGCKLCQGAGCKACQGNKKGGMGMGEGRGSGPRPEEENGTSFRDSRVGQKADQGRAVITGIADGPNITGSARAAILQEMTDGIREADDPVAIERLPRSRREHVGEYNSLIRQGK